jgi:hypothetical protein
MTNALPRVASALLAACIANVAMAQDAAAPLATVKSVNGNVLVSTADGYQPLTADMPLKAGDRLMVLEGGEVSLTYQGGCVDVVNTASVYTVPGVAPCEAVASTASTTAATGGSFSGGRFISSDGLIGIAILAGAAAAGMALDGPNDDEVPVSP